MATIAEMIVKLIADTGNFNTNMAEAATAVKASQDAMSASMQSSMQSFRDFDAIQKGSITTAQELAQAQATLTAARATGAFTDEELAAKEAVVAAAMKKVGTETTEASGALGLFTRNSRTMYSTSALVTDAMTGQFSRMRREVAALGNETGLMAQAFQFALSPAGLIAEALAAVALDAYNAAQRINELQHAALAGGGAAGMNGDQLETMAEGFKKMGFDIQSARDAMSKLAGSGRVTSADMRNATQASLEYAQLTGDKIDTLAQRFANLGTEGGRGFLKLDESMHFLTASQRENIAQLERTGQSAQAVSVGYDALATHGAMALQSLQDKGEKTEGFWAGIGTVIQNVNDSLMKGMGAGLTKQDELDKTNKLLAYYQSIGVTGQKINDLLARRASLQKQITDAARESQQASAGTQSGIQRDEALIHGGSGSKGSGIGALEQQFQQQEAKAHASYDQMKQDAVEFWNAQATNAKNSVAVQAEAYKRYVDARNQLDEQGLRNEAEADRKRAESARKGAEEARQAERGRARAMQQASQEIQNEIKQEAKQRQAIDQQGIEDARETALGELAAKRQAAQTDYAAHNISAAQLLKIETDLDQQKLAADVKYYTAKRALDDGDTAAQMRDAQAIVNAKLKAEQQMSADTAKSLKEDEQKWKQYSQRIAGAFQNATNSMLFQGQTLRNGLASVAESIFETFMQAVVEKPLQAFIAGEGGKLAATLGFGAQKTAAEEAQRATNAAADVADKTAAAARAAGLAGAQGVASFAAAPWPIDMGAPAFGAAMAAASAEFGAVASAAGGWERVPADGMRTELHRDEMVLPKSVADPVRTMAKGGIRGGGSGDIHIHAMDTRSFREFLNRNPSAIRSALGRAGRNGWRA